MADGRLSDGRWSCSWLWIFALARRSPSLTSARAPTGEPCHNAQTRIRTLRDSHAWNGACSLCVVVIVETETQRTGPGRAAAFRWDYSRVSRTASAHVANRRSRRAGTAHAMHNARRLGARSRLGLWCGKRLAPQGRRRSMVMCDGRWIAARGRAGQGKQSIGSDSSFSTGGHHGGRSEVGRWERNSLSP